MNNVLNFIKKYNILIFIILGFLLYFPSLFYDFVYDDNSFLLTNQYLNGRFHINIIDFFIPNFIMTEIYMPFTFIMYWLIIKFFSFNVVVLNFVLHFINIFVYILSSLALYYLLKKLINNDSILFFATVLYILHPCHIECTAWISALGYNISALFFFLSFLYFIIAFEENKKLNYIYSVIFYILAILSQPIAVTLPAILFLWVYCFRKEKLKESMLYIVSYIPFLFIYLFLYSQTVLTTNRFEKNLNYNFFQRLSICGFNVFNSFIPINLSPVQSIPSLSFIIPLLLFIILLYFLRKNVIYLFFCIFGIICFLPYSNIFFTINIPIADRYLLLSSVSSCVLISYLSFYILEKLKNKQLLKFILIISFIFLYLISFIFYLPIWKNDKALWTYAYNVNSDNIYVLLKYSSVLYLEHRYDEVLILADKIIEKYQKTSASWISNLQCYPYILKVKVLMKKGFLNEALIVALKLKELKPEFYESYFCLFDIYFELGQYDKSLESLKYAYDKAKLSFYKTEVFDSFVSRYMALSYIYVDFERNLEILKVISNDFKLMQDNGEFSYIINVNDYKGREEICLNYLKKYNTNYSKFVIQLLNCLYMKETYKENASEIMKSLLNDIDKAQEFINKGDYHSAEKLYLFIISKNKYMYQAYYNLGILYLQTNRKEKAKEVFIKVLNINPNDEQIKQMYNSLNL